MKNIIKDKDQKYKVKINTYLKVLEIDNQNLEQDLEDSQR